MQHVTLTAAGPVLLPGWHLPGMVALVVVAVVAVALVGHAPGRAHSPPPRCGCSCCLLWEAVGGEDLELNRAILMPLLVSSPRLAGSCKPTPSSKRCRAALRKHWCVLPPATARARAPSTAHTG